MALCGPVGLAVTGHAEPVASVVAATGGAGLAKPAGQAVEGEKGAPTVVVLVDDPDLEVLLLAKFSGVKLLARADLPKAVAERLLTGGGGAGLIGAHVALVVEHVGERGTVRMVDCESGANVMVLELPKMPAEETARWIVARVQPMLGAAADATRPRMSLLGLRFETDSPENRTVERTLNLMLTARFQARGAVVLERWRMGDLVFEKTIAGSESPFWAAAQLVDGSVSSTGGRLQARVRIRDAAGVEKVVGAEGEGPEGLADDIAERVVAGRSEVVGVTKSGSEAEAFVAEARWMLEHGLTREAWQATESAIALGGRNRTAEMLRVKAAAMCSYPYDLRKNSFRNFTYWSNAFAVAELPARVAAATEAMLLAGDYRNAYPTYNSIESWNLEDPVVLGVQSLYSGLMVLRVAHELGWADANAEAVRGLRDAIRRNVALLKNGAEGRSRQILFLNLTSYAGYWNETPAEAIAFFRRVLAPDFDGGIPEWPEVIRREVSNGMYGNASELHPPFLVVAESEKDVLPSINSQNMFTGVGSWRVPAPNSESSRTAWAAFLDELDRSPEVLHQADGLALRWQSTASNKARQALTVRMVDFILANVDALSGPQGYAIFCQLVEPLRYVNRSGDSTVAREKLNGALLALIRSEAAVPSKLLRSVFIASEGQAQAGEWLAALNARRARPSISQEEVKAIDYTRSLIGTSYPALRPVASEAGALLVQAYWAASEHSSEAPNLVVGFEAGTAVWSDDHLWVLDPDKGRLWKIDPLSGETTILAPENWSQNRYKNNQSHIVYSSQLVPWGRRFVITAEQGVWILNETHTRWENSGLPAMSYQIGVAHGDLWAASGERSIPGRVKQIEGCSLYRIAPDLTCELVASSRRRPAVHPLDEVLEGAPFSISPSQSGGVMIGTRGERSVFWDSTSATKPKCLNESYMGSMWGTGTPGLIIRRKYPAGDMHRRCRFEVIDAASDELLLSHPELYQSKQPRFPCPKELLDLPATEYTASWRNGELDILAWVNDGSHFGRYSLWLAHIDGHGSVVRPLSFTASDNQGTGLSAIRSDPVPRPFSHDSGNGLIATDKGLVLIGSRMSGFWFIPKEAIEQQRKSAGAAAGK